MARAALWRLEERGVPKPLEEAISAAPLRAASFPSGCDCCQPLPLRKLGQAFTCQATRADWLPLREQDWVPVAVQDRVTGDITPADPQTLISFGQAIVFWCMATATLSGKPCEEADRAATGTMPVGGQLQEELVLELEGGCRDRVPSGARLLSRDGDVCTFEYQPVRRLELNFAEVHQCCGTVPVDLLWFRAEALEPRRRLGRSVPDVDGLDLRFKFGLTALGVARWCQGCYWQVTWAPPDDHQPEPGDVLVTLPPPAGYPPTLAALFTERGSSVIGADRITGRPLSTMVPLEMRLPLGAAVEYYSTSHGGWLPAQVRGFDEASGNYVLDIQPFAVPGKVRPLQQARILPPTATTLPVPSALVGRSPRPSEPSYAAPHLLPNYIGGDSPAGASDEGGRVGTLERAPPLPPSQPLSPASQPALEKVAEPPPPLPAPASPPGRGHREQLEDAKARLRDAQKAVEGATRALTATWFRSPALQEALAKAEQELAAARAEVNALEAVPWEVRKAVPSPTLGPPQEVGPPLTEPEASPPPGTAEAVPPPRMAAHEMLAALQAMGFEGQAAAEAVKRCSSVEAAAHWLLERG